MYSPLPAASQGNPTPVVRRNGLNWMRIAIASTVGGLLIIGALACANAVMKWVATGGMFGVAQHLPVYPGSALLGVNESFGSNGTSVSASCDADASLDTASAFYSDRLSQQPWAVTATNPVDGTWKFHRTDGKMTGLIRLSGHGQRTRIDIMLEK